MSSNPLEAKDYLTSLPKELLQAISELVQQQWRAPYLGLVCKAFLPFARSRRFSKISIRYPYRLTQLVGIFEAIPDAGPSVKELEVDFFPSTQENEPVFPSRQDFLAFLSSLTKLESLTIKRATKLIRALLFNTSVSPLLPSLIRIKLDDPFISWETPFDPSHFYHLRRHPQLRNFHFTVDRPFSFLGHYTKPASYPEFDSTWSCDVDLKNPFARNPAMRWLLAAFTEIHSLNLAETTDDPQHAEDLPDALYGVFPYGLYSLALEAPCRPASFSWATYLLGKFPNLEALDFGPHMLYLNHILYEWWYEYDYDSDGQVKFDAPAWMEQFGNKDFEELVEMAKRNGVEVRSWVLSWMEENSSSGEGSSESSES
ncbi:hypothetical protein JCM8547_006247 [Rhodosporidiobolus lusitaniae]